MKKQNLFFIFFGLLILVGCTGENTSTQSPQVTQELDSFAQCLTEKGVTMYGTEWCGHCQNQKKLFGSSFQHIDFVDCDRESGKCQDAGIRGYPTWKVDGQNYPGEQTFARLGTLAGCELV